jgi:hypothetical protein
MKCGKSNEFDVEFGDVIVAQDHRKFRRIGEIVRAERGKDSTQWTFEIKDKYDNRAKIGGYFVTEVRPIHLATKAAIKNIEPLAYSKEEKKEVLARLKSGDVVEMDTDIGPFVGGVIEAHEDYLHFRDMEDGQKAGMPARMIKTIRKLKAKKQISSFKHAEITVRLVRIAQELGAISGELSKHNVQ